MKVDLRITQVEWSYPHYIKIWGRIWSDFDRQRVFSSEGNLAWFYGSQLPSVIHEMLKETNHLIWIELQTRGVIPKEWPEGIVEQDEEEPYPFKFSIGKTHLVDREWNMDEDIKSTVEVEIKSGHHKIPSPSIIEVELPQEHLTKLFKVLDENL